MAERIGASGKTIKQLERECVRLAPELTKELGDGLCFVLIIADVGEGGNTAYISDMSAGVFPDFVNEFAANTTRRAPVPLPSELLLGFLGWMYERDERVSSFTEECELAKEFIEHNGLNMPREGWSEYIKRPGRKGLN
jgi:hypothetical protein